MSGEKNPVGSAVIEVSAGVVFRKGQMLITRRRAQDHLGGLWEFPGGKQEPGETAKACLKRELMEELGIEAEVGELLEIIEHAYPGKTVRLKFFRCVWQQHEPQAIDCQAFAWVTTRQLKDYTFPEADQKLLERLRED